MKSIIFCLVLSFCSSLFAQQAPFIDFNNYFRTFYKGTFRQLEFQAVKSFEASDNLTVYIDYKGDFRLYDGENVQTLTNQIIQYKLSDAQLAWNIGYTLYCLNKGQKELLTTYASDYKVSDSLVIFENTRFNSVHVRYNDKVTQLSQVISVDDLKMPEAVGDNTLVFEDNGNFHKIFWRGSVYDYAVYTKPVNFSAGMDVVCFNDPINQSFTVFDKGQFLDLESLFAKKYQAARGFVVYEDQQGNLWYYAKGEKQQLSNYGVISWEAKDDLVIWNENSRIYAFVNGEKKQIINYVPSDYLLKNNTMVFRNSMGGISVLSNGKIEELTKQMDSKYSIYGNTVLVQLFNRSYIVFNDGKKYEQ